MSAPKDPIQYQKYIEKLKKSHTGYKMPEAQKQKIREGNLGKIMSIEARQKISLAQKRRKHKPLSEEGRRNMSLAKKGKKLSKEHKKKLKENWRTGKMKGMRGKIPWNKGKKYPQFSGKNASQWKGGITPINIQIRTSFEYRLWSDSVWNRDNNCCQKCGENITYKLVAHHILNFSSHIELRLAIDNGITFCRPCHKAFHKRYGKRNNTREQLLEFLQQMA